MPPRRALVAGWFSFERMGASAGDLLARDVVCRWLTETGIDYDIATAMPFTGGIDWRLADPAHYAYVIFVCGPVGNGRPLQEFFQRFEASQIIGINLSMLEPLEEWNPFALLLERDSSRTVRPDLVFLADSARVPVVGLVLIDAQPEYEGNQLKSANEIIERFIAQREMSVVRVDTRLDRNRTGLRTPAEVESMIARMDLVITTRLHGTVLALKNGVPPIAIDSVKGGAKISRQVQALGWPITIPIETLSAETLTTAFDYCLTSGARQQAEACRERAMLTLQATREQFMQFVQSSAPDRR